MVTTTRLSDNAVTSSSSALTCVISLVSAGTCACATVTPTSWIIAENKVN